MEDNTTDSPKFFLEEEQGKDNNNEGSIELNPSFDGLTPNAILNHVQEIIKNVPTPHDDILNELLDQIEPLDFKLLAFPQVEQLREKLENISFGSDEAKAIISKLDKLKVNQKHLLVLSIENVLKVAQTNQWGLCKKHDFIYLFNGTYWSEVSKEQFQKFLGEASEKMDVPKFTARYFQFKEHLYKQFLSAAHLPNPPTDKETVLINLQNGTFEINGEGTHIRPFDRSDFLTYQLPFEYNPDATAPIFKKYLDRVVPDQERQKVLAEYLGYVLIKHGGKRLKEEKALILYGTGANGKSVFFEVVSALIGDDNISNYTLQSLTNDNGYFRAKLANKLVNYGSDINTKLESALFKQLVSGEPVEARLPYGEPFILRQYGKLIFNCNELPKDVEQTAAFFRRFLIIPFDVTIPPEEQDKQLHIKIIENELSGVFNWVLDGLKRLLEQKKFSECKAAQEALNQYKIESDSVKMFVNENNYKKSGTEYTLIKELYIEYRNFCSEDGYRPVSKPNFKKRLIVYGVVVSRLNIGNVAYLLNENNLF